MKKLGRFALIGIIVVMLVASLGLTGCETAAENTEEKLYSIEQLASGWMVVIVKKDYDWGNHATERLIEGLKELGNDYEIVSIVSAEDYYWRGGVTRALFVEVKPKY